MSEPNPTVFTYWTCRKRNRMQGTENKSRIAPRFAMPHSGFNIASEIRPETWFLRPSSTQFK